MASSHCEIWQFRCTERVASRKCLPQQKPLEPKPAKHSKGSVDVLLEAKHIKIIPVS